MLLLIPALPIFNQDLSAHGAAPMISYFWVIIILFHIFVFLDPIGEHAADHFLPRRQIIFFTSDIIYSNGIHRRPSFLYHFQ